MKPNLVSFSEASKYIYHSKTLLVDLRSREAFATSHISGAWNIPYEELSQYQEEMMNYDRIIFYCDHGNHSLQAARELAKKGKWASSWSATASASKRARGAEPPWPGRSTPKGDRPAALSAASQPEG